MEQWAAVRCQIESVRHIVPGAQDLCRNWELTNFPQLDYSRRERPMSQEKLYTIISNRTASSSTKNPAVIDVSKIKEDKKKLKIREPEAAVGTYIRTAVANDAHLSFLFFMRNGLIWPMVPFR
jgi:hypothetical protein